MGAIVAGLFVGFFEGKSRLLAQGLEICDSIADQLVINCFGRMD